MELKNLNQQQKEAVLHKEGPLLILAGAGSGKTKALTHRIAYLVKERSVSPRNILAITFTNKAAQEMKDRIIKLVGEEGREVWARTFHSTCILILRYENDHLDGYAPNFVVYDDADQITLIKRVLKDLEINESAGKPRDFLSKISDMKSQLIRPEKCMTYFAENIEKDEICKVYDAYQKALKRNNAMDFDDIISETVKLLEDKPEILAKYQERFQYILVDEYQDTNYAQYKFVQLLAEKNQNITVVGDDDQSIYQWRGADVRNILSFEEEYPDSKIIKLERNYRSSHNILEAANGVIQNNSQRKNKQLWTDDAEGEPIYIYTGIDEADESFFVARQIRQMRDRNEYAFRDFAILSRTTGQFRAIEECLLKQNMPYQVFGGVKFYQRKEIKDLVAYLNVTANPLDSMSLQRALFNPKRGVGIGSWNKLVDLANEKSISIYEAMRYHESLAFNSKISGALDDFTELLEQARDMSETASVTETTEFLLKNSGYQEALENDPSVEAESRRESIEEFLSVTKYFDERNDLEEGRLAAFLSEISLYTDLDVEVDENSISIMTLHSAKGLEFPVVFILGMEENLLPHFRSLDTPEGIEEERRLTYVGFTRAEEKLYLLNAQKRMLNGRMQHNESSRFLSEIPAVVIEDLSSKQAQQAKNKPMFNTVASAQTDEEWQVGEKVSHSKWGVGVIVALQGEGDMELMSVAFPDDGIKKLIVKYAPISKIDMS